MTSIKPRNTKFTWSGLAKSTLLQMTIVAVLEYYWRWSSGRWEATSLVVIPVVVWINAVIAYRWIQIMKEQAEGTFSEEKYLADTQAYLWGGQKLRRLAILVAVAIGLACVIGINVFKL
jgi:hypothetical protein